VVCLTKRAGKLVGITYVIRYHATSFSWEVNIPVNPGRGRQGGSRTGVFSKLTEGSPQLFRTAWERGRRG
jgi:hypothetical protein